jgi:uncharacterized protein YegL
MGDNLETYSAGTVGAFQFSAAKPDSLTGAVEYTLATIVVDTTGSVDPFADALLKAVRTAVDACRKAPRADNLLVRLVTFNGPDGVREVHGFLPLNQIDAAAYPALQCRGLTNLYDAAYEAVEATSAYARILTAQDYMVNGALYIITDGDDNDSRRSLRDVKAAIAATRTGEVMESLHAALIGVNDAQFRTRLEGIQRDLGLAQYVAVDDVTPGKLAKLAAFVSKSISSQSQALGTGGPSQNLTF